MLLQFPPNFGLEHFSDLVIYLQELPKTNRYVVEVRDKAFLNEEFFKVLNANKTAFAWVDSPKMPIVEQVTADFLYLRWEGDRKKVNGLLGKIEADRTDALKSWAEKIGACLDKNFEIFGYFGKYFSGLPPSDVEQLLNLVSAD
jgi:uncharacterized protein YecE (DUF72 family)